MRIITLVLVIAVIIIFAVRGLMNNPMFGQLLPIEADYREDLLNRMNALRAEQGLYPYVLNDALNGAAMEQAQWMVDNWSFAHVHPDGSRPSTRARNAGYITDQWCCSENTYLNTDSTPDSAWIFWNRSASHYPQLVNRNFTEVGIGAAASTSRVGFVIVFGMGMSNNAPPPAVAEPITSGAVYVVRSGDNLYLIAQRHGTTVQALMALNGLTSSTIFVNQRLQIPSNTSSVANTTVSNLQATPTIVLQPTPTNTELVRELQNNTTTTSAVITSGTTQTHTVSAGENLFRIALRYQVPLNELMTVNGLTSTTIFVGQTLTIPASSGFAASSPAAFPTSDPFVTAAVSNLNAQIFSPAPQSVITQPVPIIGTARLTPGEQSYYHLFIQGGAFASWTPLGEEHYNSVENATLETLYTPALPPGSYRLRLVVMGATPGIAEVSFTVAP
jgi:LysM repeat protein